VSWLLPRLAGTGIAYEMFFTGKPLQAVDAHRLGVINRLVPADRLEAEVRELAAQLAAQPKGAMAGAKKAVTHALERRFLATGEPRDLTLVYSAGQGDRATRGVNHFGNPGMTRCVVGGHWRSATRLADLALAEQCDAFNLPQGVLTHLYRAIAGGKPGVLTKIGLHTFVDPRTELDARYHGAAINARAKAARAAGTASWVEYERFRGEDYLFYPSFPLHCVFLRGTAADPRGNISTHEEAFHHELLAMAQAARNSGGLVIAQVRRLVDRHDNLQAIHVPGILVDYVVVADDEAEHQMTFGEAFNPTYIRPWQGEAIQLKEDALEAGEALEASLHGALDARTLVQRRAVLELMAQQPRVVNLGVGMPAAVGALAEQEGARGFTLTVEAGPIGGTPADGLSFGASAYPEAVVDQPAQFDFYEGGGIDLAILGLAELDGAGNVNVSLFGEGNDTIVAGVGGFINITRRRRSDDERDLALRRLHEPLRQLGSGPARDLLEALRQLAAHRNRPRRIRSRERTQRRLEPVR
jgi:propionate CoA-transferase